MGRTLGIALLALCLFAPTPGAAEIFKWIDADGQAHFTTDLSQVPPSQRRGAEEGAKVREESDLVQRHSGGAAAASGLSRPRIQRGAGKQTYTIAVPPGATSMRVMVKLNDRVVAPFVIDTGASDVSIPRSVANELGIDPGPDAMTMQYRTANGIVESPVVSLDSVDLGGARVEDVPASISDSLPIGLLGLSYFNHFQYEIDAARGLVTLTPNGLSESGMVKGGRSEAQWRMSFRNMRSRIEAVQEELERTPSSRSRKIDDLEGQRGALLAQLSRLEAEADHARVPFGWRE